MYIAKLFGDEEVIAFSANKKKAKKMAMAAKDDMDESARSYKTIETWEDYVEYFGGYVEEIEEGTVICGDYYVFDCNGFKKQVNNN